MTEFLGAAPFAAIELENVMKVVAWIVGVPIAILLFMFALGAGLKAGDSYSPARTEKQKFTHAAAECWKEYERKSLAPDEKRSIAAMCEGLDERAK